MNPGEIYRFLTPAKINLFLRVQKKRPDGYHALLLDFHPVSLYDRIELELSAEGTLRLEGNTGHIPLEENLVVKAVRILEAETQQTIPIRIHLEKNIPSGAGLGGGSGNAAGMLVVLNRLLKISLPEERLKTMAAQLGADVPFFISPRPSLASGIGEQLSPAPEYHPLHLLLVYPGFSISTAEAYRICQISGEAAPLSSYSVEELNSLSPASNDFWIPLTKRYPELETCRSALIQGGACAAGLSGSGSTVFGVFETKEMRDLAADSLEKQAGWQVYSCRTLRGHVYPTAADSI